VIVILIRDRFQRGNSVNSNRYLKVVENALLGGLVIQRTSLVAPPSEHFVKPGRAQFGFSTFNKLSGRTVSELVAMMLDGVKLLGQQSSFFV